MKTAVLINILACCGAYNYAAYYTPQVPIGAYYFDYKNNMFCPPGGVPVCATDYYREYFFVNECRFNAENFKRFLRGQYGMF